MQVRKVGEHWVIGTNFGFADARDWGTGTAGRPYDPDREEFDVWTGDRWWAQASAALRFATEQEADGYLAQNWDHLLAAVRADGTRP